MSLGLYKDVGGSNAIDGYEFAIETHLFFGNERYFFKIWRVTNDAREQEIATSSQSPPTWVYPHLDLRRIGATVEGWASPDGANWTQVLSVEDSTYLAGTFYASIHIQGNTAINLDDFGAAASGGPQPATLTVVKEAVNDDGGSAVPSDWTMNVAGPTPLSFPGAPDPGTSNAVEPRGVHGHRVGRPGRVHALLLGRL